MTTRPQPPPDAPFDMSAPPAPGYRWEMQPDDRWRLADAQEKVTRRCRRLGCKHPPAAAFKRDHGWWLYCADHLYGRVIENGAVMCRHAVPIEPLLHPSSPEGILADLRELAARPDDGQAMRFSPRDARAVLKLIEPEPRLDGAGRPTAPRITDPTAAYFKAYGPQGELSYAVWTNSPGTETAEGEAFQARLDRRELSAVDVAYGDPLRRNETFLPGERE